MEHSDFLFGDTGSIKKTDPFLLSESLPLPTADALSDDMSFGPIIRRKNSRVIRFFRITPPIFPNDDKILENENVEYCKFVPCTFFQPGFKNLTPEQRKYFYYFCKKVEEKEKIETGFAYICLYVCRILRQIELIADLPDSFYWVWETYRRDFPLLDKLFSDTLCDFCFYKNTKPNFEKLEKIFLENDFRVRPFLFNLYLFDHLFAENKKLSTKEINFILRTLTGESFRKSKAYRTNPRFAATCEEVVFRAFEKGLVNKKSLNGNLFSIKIPSEVHTVRSLFPGLPENEIIKAKINLCHVPLLHDGNIRWRCDELVRYLENRIRGIFKIKNTLSRICISEEHKAFLEEILSPLELQAKKAETHQVPFMTQMPREEKRKPEIDLKKAAEIESASWEITEKLTQSYLDSEEEFLSLGQEKDENFDQEYQAELEKLNKPSAPVSENEFWEFAASLSESEDAYFSILLYFGKEIARQYAATLGAFTEAFTASCNEKAMDTIGDAVIDTSGDIYKEYHKDLKEVFLEPKGNMSK